MSELTKGRVAYGWLWAWLLLVVAASAIIYREAVYLAAAIVTDIPAVSKAMIARDVSATASLMSMLIVESVAWIGGVLFCWRTVKVVVLHGSPYSPWLDTSSGREDRGVSGRVVHYSHIGDHAVHSSSFTGVFWFGVIFRAHPRSDKLVRTRLEFLIAALPFGRALFVEEGRVRFPKLDHSERARNYTDRRGKYARMIEFMSPDRFRRDMVRYAKAISDHLNK